VVEITILGDTGWKGADAKAGAGTHVGTMRCALALYSPRQGNRPGALDVLVGPARVLNFTPCKALQEIDVRNAGELGGKFPRASSCAPIGQTTSADPFLTRSIRFVGERAMAVDMEWPDLPWILRRRQRRALPRSRRILPIQGFAGSRRGAVEYIFNLNL